MAASQKPGPANCRIFSEEGSGTNLELLLSFVGKDQKAVGAPVDLSKFKAGPWVGKDAAGKDVKLGVVYTGEADIPKDAVNNVLYLSVKPDAKVDMEYINKVEITADREGDGGGISIAPNSWIHKSQGNRFFFASGLAYLRSQTPPELAAWRVAELSGMKGTPEQQKETRAEWDRVYDYDVYNDLAKPTETRPVLGGSKDMPYPRRIRTGRPIVAGPDGQLNYESRETATGSFWVPLDERFNTVKNSNFKTYGLLATIPATAQIMKDKLNMGKGNRLKSFKEVEDLYAEISKPEFTLGIKEFTGAILSGAGRLGSNALKRFGINPADLPALQVPKLGTVTPGAVGSSIENITKLVGGVQNLLEFPPPLVAKNRGRVWDTDEEWGRQALAGVNPSWIEAVTSKAQLGAITEALLEPHLQSQSLAALFAAAKAEPRLLVIDHTSIADYVPKISAIKGRYGYSGRAVLFQRDDGQWVPVGIELTNAEKQTTVYTPADHPNVWRLAKGAVLAIDCAYHQLITHWLRCHACTEPYIIATHRCLSSLHPVYKLVVPHWRFTPNINSNARLSLINADGILEKTVTLGPYAFEMTAKEYGARWRFDQQGLPADLVHRGLAKKGTDGKVQLLLKDYPYADDGMLIWDALHSWVGKYLRCYYDDSVPAKSVVEDVEIMSWWQEILTKGHPDKKEGWPELKTIDDLTEILTTMIWVASAHHAAINFSQYAMDGFILNRSPAISKAIPQKDTPAYQELIKSKEAGEKVFLETFMDENTWTAVLTVELLSTHADNEAYLGDPNHPYILDPQPLKLYKEFAASIRQVEATINARNKDPKYKTRSGGTALAYEFLAPSSGPGITNRGVPQSVSI